MSGLILLSPAAWLPAAAGGFAAGFDLPGPGGLAIEAAGWAHPAAARLLPPEGAPVHFVAVPGGGFLAAQVAAGGRCTVQAPVPPSRCRVLLVPRPAASPSLALLAPRAVHRPSRPAPFDLAAARARIAAALGRQDLDAALGAAAEMLVAARQHPATQVAAAAVLDHLARHPLCRSPALGAFVAALTE